MPRFRAGHKKQTVRVKGTFAKTEKVKTLPLHTAQQLSEYPWTAAINRGNGSGVQPVPRPKLVDGKFPLTGLTPIYSYIITDPNCQQRKLELDDTQIGAVNLILSGASCCIIGAAGTGKSTILQAAFELITPHLPGPISYRIVRSNGQRAEAPPVALISFTNKAVNVIKDKIRVSQVLNDAGYGYNVTTVHNLLEFTRVQEWNEEKECEVMRFREQRNEYAPLHVKMIAVDESSMVGVGKADAEQIGNKLHNALVAGTQEVLMGDINQLPPVGGKSILSYGLAQLPIAELTTIHRQALDSPIIAQAWNILQGKPIEDQVNTQTGSYVRIISPKKNGRSDVKLSAGTFNLSIEQNLPKFLDKGLYVPGRDIILTPVNKPHSKCGQKPYVSTSHINAVIATHLARKYKRLVYEIIAGFNKVYLSEGDRVLVDKIEGTVTKISKNSRYYGKVPRDEAEGMAHPLAQNVGGKSKVRENIAEDGGYDYSALDIDDLPTHIEDEGEEGRQASHLVDVELDTGDNITLSTSGEFGPQVFSLGYAISVHKSQGSEWENVFVVLHDGLPGMLSRELLYTAATRPKSKLIIIAQPHTIQKTIKSVRIKGRSIQAKIDFFNEGEYLNAGEDFTFNHLSQIQLGE